MGQATDNAISNSSELFGSDRMWGLRELPLPEVISYFPQTMGWIYLLIIALSLIVIFGVRRYLRWKDREYLRDAVRQLRQVCDAPEKASLIPYILKSVVLKEARRDEVATLRAADWTNWLNSKLLKPIFDDLDGKFLDEIPYKPYGSLSKDNGRIEKLAQKAILWVELHHV